MIERLVLRRARQRSGQSLRELARRAGTSHATLAAYEAGRVRPSVDTFERVLGAAGYTASVVTERRVAPDPERSAELLAVLELAELFPVRRRTAPLPVFPAGPRTVPIAAAPGQPRG